MITNQHRLFLPSPPGDVVERCGLITTQQVGIYPKSSLGFAIYLIRLYDVSGHINVPVACKELNPTNQLIIWLNGLQTCQVLISYGTMFLLKQAMIRKVGLVSNLMAYQPWGCAWQMSPVRDLVWQMKTGQGTTWQHKYILIVKIIVSTLDVSSHFSSKIAQEYQLPTASQVSRRLTFMIIM